DKREDLFQLIGVHVSPAEQPSVLAGFRRRLPWLTCNVAGGILAAFLAGIFEETLTRAVTLALFIPVVLNLAESVSTQSVSLTLHLRGARRRPSWRGMPARVRDELSVGLLLGAACGLVVGLVAVAWKGEMRVALALLGGITGGVAFSAVLGLALPLVLRL